MAEATVQKTVRINDYRFDKNGAKLEVWLKGRHKYLVWYLDPKEIKSSPSTNIEYLDSKKISASLNDDDVISQWIALLNSQKTVEISLVNTVFGGEVKVIQDPYRDVPPTSRIYGKTPYYLNDGSYVLIKWWGDKTRSLNDDFENGYKTVEIYPPVQNLDYYKFSNFGLQYSKMVKSHDLNIPENIVVSGGVATDINSSGKETKWSTGKDQQLIENVIEQLKSKLADKNQELSLCDPSTETCTKLTFVDYLNKNQNTTDQTVNSMGMSQSTSVKTVEFNFKDLPDTIEVQVAQDLKEFKVYVGNLPPEGQSGLDYDEFDQLSELDPEYSEVQFSGEEESPVKIPEANTLVSDGSGANQAFVPSVTGNLVNLPRDYSHTTTQGYNIINSNWIGDLITSAKSHIGHPTFDINGTDNGNLGCASAVSMIFYRAFGVHMKTGKTVINKPTQISDFGSKGTSELSGWFSNTSLYRQINWEDAQPGDIMNTARNFSTGQAGHIGVVINEKAKDGSWAIVSNSSKGFAGGGGGAIKNNYSVTTWRYVYKRNPSQTFAYRYIGPKLQSQKLA